jgi:broad specificity phosphatase PhoE
MSQRADLLTAIARMATAFAPDRIVRVAIDGVDGAGKTTFAWEAMHENDRSSTGFLPPSEFEMVANQFFAKPLVSTRGWERAIDAQLRIVREVEHVLTRNRAGDVLFVGHGAVGTLLFCHYSNFAIDRAHDQSAGGGHYFAFVKDGRRVLHSWRPMEHSPCE